MDLKIRGGCRFMNFMCVGDKFVTPNIVFLSLKSFKKGGNRRSNKLQKSTFFSTSVAWLRVQHLFPRGPNVTQLFFYCLILSRRHFCYVLHNLEILKSTKQMCHLTKLFELNEMVRKSSLAIKKKENKTKFGFLNN